MKGLGYNKSVLYKTKWGEKLAAAWTETELSLLRQTALFGTLSPSELHGILARPECIRGSYAKGDVIYAPHAFQRNLGVLLSGVVEVTKGELIVSVLRKGELFGAAALFNEEPDYATTLTARIPSEVLFFPQELISCLMEQYPVLAMGYVRYLSGRIRFLSGKIEDLIAGSAERRLEQYLLARLEDGRVKLDCPATALARRLNMSRASLYRAFELLEAAGVIRREGKAVFMTAGAERNDFL